MSVYLLHEECKKVRKGPVMCVCVRVCEKNRPHPSLRAYVCVCFKGREKMENEGRTMMG